MKTAHGIRSSRSRSRGDAWLYFLTLAILIASFGAALVLILLTPY